MEKDFNYAPPSTIYAKLLKAKDDFGTVFKNKANPHFKSLYADLSAILDAVEPALHKNGLILTQPIINDSVVSQITCIESGETIESSLKLPTGIDPQKMGAAITYYRRFSLQSLLGLAAEDNDGNDIPKPAPYKAPSLPIKPPEKVAVPAVKPTASPYAETVGTNAGYLIGFGKYKGRSFGSIGPAALAGYVKWIKGGDDWQKNAATKDLVEKAEVYLKSLSGN